MGFHLMKCKASNGQLRHRRKLRFLIYRNYEHSITDNLVAGEIQNQLESKYLHLTGRPVAAENVAV